MKRSLVLALTAAVSLAGCSLFDRSPTWDAVVKSRTHFRDEAAGKGGYIEHLHRVLSDAGIEHKIVTYQFHFWNAYREDSVQTAVAVLYRDEANPRYPWWVMDEYRNVPVWLPNYPLEKQLAFFLKRDVQVLEEKEYVLERTARVAPRRVSPRSLIAQSRPPQKSRSAVTGSIAKRHAPARPPADPLSATSLAGGSADAEAAIFRSAHGTDFDPGSSLDRRKMDALRRQLLNRNRSVQLRPE